MPSPADWPLYLSLLVFLACAGLIAVAGTRVADVADALADRLGLGEAIMGMVLLGAVTSLGGLSVVVTAAVDGHPEIAVGEALGGIAVQTFILVLADLAYDRGNLEHAAASPANLMNLTVLMVMLLAMLLAALLPPATVLAVHPVTVVLAGFYLYAVRMVRAMRLRPMWYPRRTAETRLDEPAADSYDRTAGRLWVVFVAMGAVLVVAGWGLTRAAEGIIVATGLSGAAMGALFTAWAASLPEFVTAVAAVRRGALTLAVGGIIGGNAFDVLQLAVGDVAYRGGSIYHAVSQELVYLVVLTLLMAAVLMLGLLRREARGMANIGFEGVVIAVLYVGGMALLFVV